MNKVLKNRNYRSFLIVVLISLSVKFLALYKDRLIATSFGLSKDLDAFYFALTAVAFPSAIFLNAVQTAIVPFCISNCGGGKLPRDVYRQLLVKSNFVHFLMVVVWLLLCLLGAVLLRVDSGKVQFLGYWMLINIPHVLLSAVVMIQHGLLQASGHAKTISLLPGLVSLSIVSVLFIFNTDQVELLVLAYTIAVFIEYFICRALLRVNSQSDQISETEVAKFWSEVKILTIVFVFLSSVPVVDKLIALSLNIGDLASVNFGGKVPLAVNGLILTGINIVFLPSFSRDAMKMSANELKTLYFRNAVLLATFLSIVALIGVFSSESIVKLLFQGGEIGVAEVGRVNAVQIWYFWTLPLAAVSTLGIKFLVAVNQSKLVSSVTKITVPINILVSWYCAKTMGAPGIAVGSVVTLVCSCILIIKAVTSFKSKD